MTPTSQTSDLEYADYLDTLAEDILALKSLPSGWLKLDGDDWSQTAEDLGHAALRIKLLVAEVKGRDALIKAYQKGLTQ